jgi:hypothetical protein
MTYAWVVSLEVSFTGNQTPALTANGLIKRLSLLSVK